MTCARWLAILLVPIWLGAAGCGDDDDDVPPIDAELPDAPPPDAPPPCTCDNTAGKCEAAAQGMSDTCACDPDCAGGQTACSNDSYCDTWCPADPDC